MNRGENTEEIVVTGVGVVSPFGVGVEPFKKALEMGECAAKPITAFQPKDWCKVRLAAMVPDFPFVELLNNHKESKRASRQMQLAWTAMHLALLDSGLSDSGYSNERTGLFTGLSRFFTDRLEFLFEKMLSNKLHEILPLRVDSNHPNGTAIHLTYIYKILGPTLTFCASGQSSIQALEAAILYLNIGRIDTAVVLSADVVTPFQFHSEAASGTLSSETAPGTAPRPFDKDADGAVMGEGAAALILERGADARARGKKTIARIVSVNTFFEPMPFPPFDDRSQDILTSANAQLLSNFDPTELDLIHAEGRGVPCMDVAESLGIRKAFNKKADSIPVTSTQGSYGNAGGTSSLFQIISTALAFSSSSIPPIGNLVHPAHKCDLDYVTGTARLTKVEQALVLAHGWGGHHSAVLMRKE